MVKQPTEEDCGADEIGRIKNESNSNEAIEAYQHTSENILLHDIMSIWQKQDQGQKRDIDGDNVMLEHMGKHWQQKSSRSKDMRYEKSEKQFLSYIQTFSIRLLYIIALFTIAMTSVDPNNFIQRQRIVETFSQDGVISPDVSISTDINT